jgi:predicted phage tail protein
MVTVKNLTKDERIVRTILGGILIVVSFFLHGFWRPLSLVVGLILLFTAFAAY